MGEGGNVFADAIKVFKKRAELSRWALNPVTSVFFTKERKLRKERSHMETGRGWRSATTSQGTLGAPSSWEKQGGGFQGNRAPCHLATGLPASRTMRK